MNGLVWYRCYPRDFNDGMTGLSMEERGAYITVLNCIYARGGPVLDDSLYFRAALCCSVRAWTRVRAALIVKKKLFEISHNGELCLMNARAAAEIAESREKSLKFADAGRAGAAKVHGARSENNDLGVARPEPGHGHPMAYSQSDTDTEIYSLSSEGDDKPSGRTQYPEPFEAAWKAYPHIRGRSSKPKALGFWRRLAAPVRQALPTAIARYAREGREPRSACGAPGMDRWLRDAKYEDWLTASAPILALPVTPEIRQHRLRHFADTGEWRDVWGERPDATDPAREEARDG